MPQNSTVLIVEDDATSRLLLRGLLAPLGCRLLVAENGLQALDQARTTAPDLVISDVMMPGLNGIELCRTLRSDPAWAFANDPAVQIAAGLREDDE